MKKKLLPAVALLLALALISPVLPFSACAALFTEQCPKSVSNPTLPADEKSAAPLAALFSLVPSLSSSPSEFSGMSGDEILEEYLSRRGTEPPRVISDLIAIWNENGILLNLPERDRWVMEHDDYSWDRYDFSDDFNMIYSIRYDGSRDSLMIFVPVSYRPAVDLMILTIQSMLDIQHDDAIEIMQMLEYNILNYTASYDVGPYEITLIEGRSDYMLTVIRNFK